MSHALMRPQLRIEHDVSCVHRRVMPERNKRNTSGPTRWMIGQIPALRIPASTMHYCETDTK